MKNCDLEATWEYHNKTKHPYMGPHYLDWANEPLPFKIYSTLEPIPLPHDTSPSGVSAFSAISARDVHTDGDSIPDLETLAQMFYFSAGITKSMSYPGGEIFFRAAVCTGALYHIDLYLVCGDLQDLEAGVYHFGVHDFALRRLRKGDYRGLLVAASGGESSIASAPAIIICTDTYWRNAWKYQARAYRHSYWDNGTILANLLAVAAAHEIPARVVIGFVDAIVNQLLELNSNREVALSLVSLGCASDLSAGPPPAIEPLNLETVPLSSKEVDYPAIGTMHLASSLINEEEVMGWRSLTPTAVFPESSGRLFPLEPCGNDELPQEPIERVILRRGSTRQFTRESINFRQFSTMIYRATQGIPADFLDPVGATLNDLYLIVNAVDGLPAGAYVLRRDKEALELLKEDDFRDEAGYLGLGQEIPADASVNVFVLADLKPILERFGNRGYRAAQLEAGIIGGKLYLSAYGQRLGASGLTFYDDDVTEFFPPHAKGKSVMFLVALGKSVRRKVR